MNIFEIILSIIFFVCFPAIAAVTQAQSHPFTVYDLLAMDRISDPRVSPDGKSIVFVVSTTDLNANRGRKDLWIINTDGTGLKQLTTDPENDSDPYWAADGESIFFISARSGTDQVWQVFLNSGKIRQVTDLPLDVGFIKLSPDGIHLAFTLKVFPGMSIEQTVKKMKETNNRKASGVIYDRLMIRHWDAWEDGRRSHLFVMPASGGQKVDVMLNIDGNTPDQPFGDMREVAFTPDGKGLVFSTKNAGKEEAWSTNWDLYYVPLDASREPVCLTTENKAWDTAPVFSPDVAAVW